MYRYTAASFLAVVIAATTMGAYAAKDGGANDALALSHAKIPLVQAVSVAEAHVQGKAARVEFEQAKTGWVYDVEVVNGTKVFDVAVNAETGTVVSSSADTTDHDDAHDRQD